MPFLKNANFENLLQRNLQNFQNSNAQEITKSLQKLGFNNLFDFLLNPPKNYQNHCEIENLENGANGAIKVKIISNNFRFGAKINFLKISAHAPKFDKLISLIIFHPKPFIAKSFETNKELIIYGKVEIKDNFISIIQPKIIKEFGEIFLEFKQKGKAQKTLNDFAKLLNENLLRHCGLPQKYAQNLLKIFKPDSEILANKNEVEITQTLAFVEMFYHALNLRSKNLESPANFALQNDITPFIKSLPFELTNGQKNAINDIRADLASPIAQKRLIMGDVGCGKTIVILAATMLAYPKKSVLMAPTSILANQLYAEAKKLLPNSVKIKLITANSSDEIEDLATQENGVFEIFSNFQNLDSQNFKKTSAKKSKTKKDSEKIAQNADFIIGTQALLYRDFDPSDFALVMTDEQHRFGTNQRYKLEKMFFKNDAQNSENYEISEFSESNSESKGAKSKPHCLQFSATPIPRTMAMANSFYIKQSIIADLPFKKDIETSIIAPTHLGNLLAHLDSEFAQNRQAIIVYPLVDESENSDYKALSQVLEFWKKKFEKVYATSGKDSKKDEILQDFAQNGNLLLATTIVEVGISLPRLSTIIITAPERMGLATLHQLRGRVSRNGLKGYCFLMTKTQNQASLERLKAFAKCQNGFEIAELDLKNRDSGDLLSGKKQSGKAFEYFDFVNNENILQEIQEILN